MKLRFPLYGQILFWFFLNLTLVAIALYLVCSVIFGMDVRSLAKDGVEERMVAAGREVGKDLRDAPRDAWDEILVRYGNEYQVEFFLYQTNAEEAFVEAPELPSNLVQAIKDEHLRPPVSERAGRDEEGFPGPHRRGPGPEGRPRDERRPPRDHPEGRPPRGEGPGILRSRPGIPSAERDARTPPRPRLLFYERAGTPPRYWAGAWIPLFNSEYRHPVEGILVARASALRGNKVFVDWKPWLWALLVVLGVSALIWLPFVHGLARRLRRLTSVAEAISEGEFAVTDASKRSDEIGRLSRAIRSMSLRLDDFVAGQRRFLGDTAHELCSPLARIRMNLGLLEREIPDAQRERLGELESEVEELSQLVNELLAFSKASMNPTTLPAEEVNLLSLVESLVAREASGTDVVCDISPSITCKLNAGFAQRAVGNLLRNAVRYAGEAGPITIAAQDEEGEITLTITDQGPGIPEEWLEKVLEPFARPESARTREGGGVGLGLAIAKTCMAALGGSIELRNGREKGLIATLTFPSVSQTNPGQTS